MTKNKPNGFSNASKILGIVTGLVMLCSIVQAGRTVAPAPRPSPSPRPYTQYVPPTLSCGTSAQSYIEVTVTGDSITGAPAGFTIQWETLSDYQQFGWNSNRAPSYCAASLSGVPGASQWDLAPGASVTVQIGDNLFDTLGASSECASQSLICGTQYVFRAFAHATSGVKQSGFGSTLTCQTLPCVTPNCTYTQGYWKTHGPEGCVEGNNSDQWSSSALPMLLGNLNYTDLQLCAIFNTPAAGNGLISLAHQLIAAKLNIAKGADPTSIAATISAAD